MLTAASTKVGSGPMTSMEFSMAGKTATALKKVRELTEEEILKAPEKDYMNEAQLAFFRQRLVELRDQDRVVVLLDLLGRSVPAQLTAAALEAA